MKEIFVGNLIYGLNEKDLWRLFKQFGRIVSVRIIRDREENLSRGFGFVKYREEKDAKRAIKEMNDVYYEGRVLTVAEAVPYEKDQGGKGSPEKREPGTLKP